MVNISDYTGSIDERSIRHKRLVGKKFMSSCSPTKYMYMTITHYTVCYSTSVGLMVLLSPN